MNKAKLPISLLSMRAFLNFSAAIIIVAAAALPTMAYEEDTHFLLTYIIGRSVGLSEEDALTVAEVDQGMDDSNELGAFYFKKTELQYTRVLIPEQWLWHAIRRSDKVRGADTMTAADIVARRKDLFDQAISDPNAKNRLIRLGVFFHYQQDSWAHRDHSEKDQYKPVDTPKGHARWGGQPDRPPYDPVTALMCLEEGVVYASDFVGQTMKNAQNAFLKDYKPLGGEEDSDWTDNRGGKHFNQISLAGIQPGSARLFLTSLIRAQIDAYRREVPVASYSEKIDLKNQADLARIKDAFEKVCKTFKSSLGMEIKLKPKRGCFNKMKTMQLLSRSMSGVEKCG